MLYIVHLGGVGVSLVCVYYLKDRLFPEMYIGAELHPRYATDPVPVSQHEDCIESHHQHPVTDSFLSVRFIIKILCSPVFTFVSPLSMLLDHTASITSSSEALPGEMKCQVELAERTKRGFSNITMHVQFLLASGLW